MPYDSVSELPDAVKKLPPKLQRAWMKIWNATYKRCMSQGGKAADCEKRAFKFAWGVVKRMQKK